MDSPSNSYHSSDSDEDRDGMLVVDDASNNEEDDVEMKTSETLEDENGDGDGDYPDDNSSHTSHHHSYTHDDQDNSDGENEVSDMLDPEEKHRLETLDNMEKIEKEFSDLKEKFFRDQIQSLKDDIAAIRGGTHEKFREQMEELDELRQEKLWRAEQWREYQLRNVEHVYQAEKQQASDEFESDKRQVRTRLLNSIQEKMKKLEEEKNMMNLTADGGESRPTRNLRRRNKERENKEYNRRRLNPPHINYTLKDPEIYEDLNYMNKHHPSDANFDRQRWIALAPLSAGV